MSKRSPIVAAVLFAGLFVASGCASTKIHVSPQVRQAEIPASHKTAYRIEGAKILFAQASVGGGAMLPSEWRKDGFAQKFTRMAEERYPALFNQGASAVPLKVSVTVEGDTRQGAALGVYLCTLCIIGGIFPSVPWETEWGMKVTGEVPGYAHFATPKTTAIDRGWWSILTPFGLITIPGESDVPKASAVLTAGPGVMPDTHRAYALQCMIDQLAAELLKGGGGLPPAVSSAPGIPQQPVSTMPDTEPLF